MPDNYGSAGLLRTTWTNPSQFAHLPEWLRRQIIPIGQDESTTTYGFGSGIQDQQGRWVNQTNLQAGDTSRGDGSLIDPNAVWDDPILGHVTGTDNERHVQSASFRNGMNLTRALIGGMAGAGLLSELGGANGLLGNAATDADIFSGAQAAGSLDGVPQANTLLTGANAAQTVANNVSNGAPGSPGVAREVINVTANALPGGAPAWLAPAVGVAGAGAATSGIGRETINVNADRLPPETPGPTLPGILGGAAIGAGASGLSRSGGRLGTGNGTGEPKTPGNDDPFGGLLGGNPLQIFGLLQGLSGLVRRPNTPAPPETGGTKGGGGTPVDMNVQRGPYVPNPITQQQVANFRYTRPRGM